MKPLHVGFNSRYAVLAAQAPAALVARLVELC